MSKFFLTNLSKIPTKLGAGKRVILEAHILEFDRELYGRYIQVELVSKLRNDGHITSEKELIEQVKKDIKETQRYLKNISNE